MRYAALLRGINVGGYQKIAMADLRELLEALGLTDVKTHLQSGNAIFSSEVTAERWRTTSRIGSPASWG